MTNSPRHPSLGGGGCFVDSPNFWACNSQGYPMNTLEKAVANQNLVHKCQNILAKAVEPLAELSGKVVVNKDKTLTFSFPKLKLPAGVSATWEYIPEKRDGKYKIDGLVQVKLEFPGMGRSVQRHIGSVRDTLWTLHRVEIRDEKMTAKKIDALREEKRALYFRLHEIDVILSKTDLDYNLIYR